MPPLAALPAASPLDAQQIAAAARALGASGGGAGTARLLALLYDPEVDVEAVLKCLRAEPALAARVLKVANAPYYGQAGRVGTVDRAVQMLGLRAIRGIAAAGCLDRLAPPRAGTAFDPERFRQHSLAVASAAGQLCRLAGAGIDGEAFMAGLLHDIGLLLLARLRPQHMGGFQPDDTLPPDGALQQQRRHFGATHLDCNDALIDGWGLPAWLGGAISGQVRPAGAPRGDGLALLPPLLALADGVARAAGFGLWPGYPLAPVAPDALGLAQDQLDRLAADLGAAVQRLAP